MKSLQSIRSDYYEPVLAYNQLHAGRIDKLCAPLKDCFGIETFGYFRGFDEGKYLFLSNDPILTGVLTTYDFFVRTSHFKKEVKKYNRLHTFKGLWPDPSKDTALQMIKSRGGRFKGFYMVRQNQGAFEVLIFAYDENKMEIQDFFVSNSDTLEKFADRFLLLAADLCDPSDMTKLGTSPNILELCPRIDDMFMDEAPWQNELENFQTQLDNLLQEQIEEKTRALGITPRELEILNYLSKGKTAKEIAALLDTSNRTIEVHIYNLRAKTGCHNRFALTKWFEDKFGALF